MTRYGSLKLRTFLLTLPLHRLRLPAFVSACLLFVSLGCSSGDVRQLAQRVDCLCDSVVLAEEDGPVCRASLQIVTFESTEPSDAEVVDCINDYILTTLLGQPAGLTAEEALAHCMDDYMREFTHVVREMYCEDLQQSQQQSEELSEPSESARLLAARYSYDYRTEASAQTGREDTVVCYRLTTYRFMGGAHGMSSQRWVTFSLRSGRPVTWQQLFGEEAEEWLCQQLTNKLMEQEGVECMEDLHELGFLDLGDMFVSNDMLMEPDRIVFHYDPYELAPYVLGDIDIAFSYDELPTND